MAMGSGEPIDLETAAKLRHAMFGSSTYACRPEWISSSFVFNPPETTFAYGLIATKNGTKGVMMCVQAYVLKNLLFQNKGPKRTMSKEDRKEILLNLVRNINKQRHLGEYVQSNFRNILKPNRAKQQQALLQSLSDIIWKCGIDNNQCTVCITDETSHVKADATFTPDGVTEKLVLFKFKKQDELTRFLNKHLHTFQQEGGAGVLKLAYSALLSRGFDTVKEDQSTEVCQMIAAVGDTHISFITLLLSGRATSYLHNGIVNVSENGMMPKEQIGICIRSEIGLLYSWRKDDDSKEVGSRMKTPMFPVWVTCGNDQYGVLFNPNRDLLRDHRAEHLFNLHYYNSSPSLTKTTVLTLDTRFSKVSHEEDYKIPVLEKMIISKWQGATVNWNGVTPYL